MCSGRVEIIPNVWRGAKFAEDTNMIEQVMSSLFLAKYFVRVRGAGVEVRCDIGIRVSAVVVLRGWDCEGEWQGCGISCL